MNLPNKITIIRIFLVIPIIALFTAFIYYVKNVEQIDFNDVNTSYMSQYFLYAIAFVFIISMLSDFLDGYLARKNNQVTAFGKLFDPLADKIITTTVLIFLAVLGYAYVWVVLIFVIRDLIVDGSRNLIAAHNLKFEASIYGKLKTLLQSIAIPVILIFTPLLNKDWIHILALNLPLIFAALMSIFSGIQYFLLVLPIINKDK